MVCTFFLNQLFQKKIQKYHQSVKQLDPNQARHFVGTDLGTNCLQRLSVDDKRYHWQTGKELIFGFRVPFIYF